MLQADLLRSGGGTHRGFLQRIGAEGGARRRFWHCASLYHQSVLALEKQQFAVEHFKQIIAVSNEVKRDIMAHYSVPERRISVLYNGVDQERFHPSLKAQWRARVRMAWGVPDQASVVLFVGSGFRRKGLDRLLAVWNLPQFKEAYLLVVGEDARMRHYRARAKAVAGERIIFTGHQAAVEKYYGAADLVVLPSIQEAFGNVVLEGLACGIPVVVMRTVGAADVLQGAMAGGIVTVPDDPNELAAKIVDQLRRSQELSCAPAARRLAERYTWQTHFRELEALIMRVRDAKQGERVS